MLAGASIFGKADTTYSNDVWEGSTSQTAMRNAYSAGVKRILVTDNGLRAAVKWGTDLVGSDNDNSDGKINRFSSYASLDNWVQGRLEKYCYENGFYGIVLNDEPVYGYTANLGEVYKSIKRVAEKLGIEVYIHLNLLPADVELGMLGDTSITNDIATLYRSYIENIIIATQADRLSLDIYPFMDWGFKTGYFSMLQVFADVCKEYGVKKSLCVQSFYSEDLSYRSALRLDEIYYQLYNAFGFGFDHIYFYTYLGNYNDGSGFVNSDGTTTEYYNNASALISAFKEYADLLAGYSYDGANIVGYTTNFSASDYIANWYSLNPQNYGGMQFDNTYDFKDINGVSVDDDLVLITALKNKFGNNIYMFQNVMDPYYTYTVSGDWWEQLLGKKPPEDGTVNITATFESDVIAVYEYYIETITVDGNTTYQVNSRYVSLLDGAYTKLLNAGEAVYLMPVYR